MKKSLFKYNKCFGHVIYDSLSIEDDNINRNFYDHTGAMSTENCRHHWHILVSAILICMLQEYVSSPIIFS